jgi:hypothetical protein
MQGVFAAALAILLQFEAVRVVPLALLARVVTLLAVSAGQVYHDANFFFRHLSLPFYLVQPEIS